MDVETATADEILTLLADQGTRRVKLGITDIDGVIRGKYLTMEKFASLAESSAGFCDCIFGWDVADQLYDNVAFSNWSKGFPDVPFRLDLSSMRWLPDEPDTPYFIAELVPNVGDKTHPICPRNLLARVLARADDMGYAVRLAFEYEMFLFRETPASVREKAYRDLEAFTPGMFGYSVLRSSVHSDLHQELLDYCEAMEFGLEGYHTETGPGVMEASLRHAPALDAADRATLFKTFSKVFFQRHGLMATFMAKWSADYPGQSGHLHLSLYDKSTGESVFHDPERRGRMSEAMEHFVGGQVAHMRDLCAMVAPTINSYTRLVKGAWAPTAAAWGIDNRTAAIRVIPGGAGSQRVEYRLGGADGNPYLVAVAALAAGLDGIDRKTDPPDPVEGNAYDVQDALPGDRQLPSTLREAAELMKRCGMARRWFGEAFVDHFTATRVWEAREFERSITDWEMARYFEII